MKKFFKRFSAHSDYETFKSSEEYIMPNVSACSDMVHYNPWVETRLIVTFDLTNISNPTPLKNVGSNISFSEIEIDGVVQPSVVYSYQFNTTGEHVVKYTLSNPTSIDSLAFNGMNTIKSIIIPSSVTSIGKNALSQMQRIISITCLATTAPTIYSNTFNNIKTGGTLYVPIGSTGYDTWMGTVNYYLGLYNWTKVEQ